MVTNERTTDINRRRGRASAVVVAPLSTSYNQKRVITVGRSSSVIFKGNPLSRRAIARIYRRVRGELIEISRQRRPTLMKLFA